MVDRRLIKKIVSTVSAVAIAVTTINIVPVSYFAKASENNEEDYINEKYLTETDEKNIGGAIAYGDGLVLISNMGEKANTGYLYDIFADTYNLTEDSELKFVDSNGINHTISNKDENGNKKYDSIYGTLTNAYYTYLKVKKDGKSSLIDADGNRIKLGHNSEYDEIDLYRDENGKLIYKLVNYVDDDKKIFDVELVGGDGNTIFNLEKCKKIYYNKQFDSKSKDVSDDNYFIALTADSNKGYLINGVGKILYETQAEDIAFDSCLKWCYFGYNGVYTYYNLNNGKIINLPQKTRYSYNTSNIFGLYYILTDKAYIGYDSDYNEVITIPGAYKNVKYIWSDLILTNSDGIGNIYDIDGKPLFEYDVKVEDLYSSSALSGVLIKDCNNNQESIAYDNGNKKVSLNVVKEIADNKLSEMNYDVANIKNCSYKMTYTGINFTYTFSDGTEKTIISISSESDYKEAILSSKKIEDDSIYTVKDNEVVKHISNKCYHVFELVNKEITDEYGTLRQCKYKLSRTYYLDKDNVKIKYQTKDYYTDNINLYDEDGVIHGLNEYGNITDKYTEGIYRFTFGDSGIKGLQYNIRVNASCIAGGITITGRNGEVIYEEEGYSVEKPLRNLFDYGYMNFSGRRILTYNGELALKSSQYCNVYQNKGLAYVLINGKLYKFKNLLVNKLEDIITSETGINIIQKDDESEIKLLTGIKDNKLAGDIKAVLNNSAVKIIDKDGNELSDTEKLGTGSKVQLFNDNQVVDSATIVIKGDTDGTGTIDVLDMEAIQKSILGIGDKLSGAYKEAASLTGGEDITVLDMEAIQKDILGIQKIN